MRRALLALASAVGTIAVPAVAHPDGHGEYVPQRRPIAEMAQDSVVKLVTQAKLSASWAKAKPLKSEVRSKSNPVLDEQDAPEPPRSHAGLVWTSLDSVAEESYKTGKN